jgi:hypothetical protein
MKALEDPNNANRKAAWIADAYTLLKGYKNVKAVLWENRPDETWRINSSTTTLKAYRSAVGNGYYKTTVP